MASLQEKLDALRAASARAGVRGPGATGAMRSRGYVPKPPSKLVPQQLRDALMNKAARGDRLSDSERAILEEAARQQRAGRIPPYEPGNFRNEPAAASAPDASPASLGVPREAVQIIQDGKKFYLVDAGNVRLEEVKSLGDGYYAMPNGTRLQLTASGEGFEVVPGDLATTTAAGADNLDASAVAIDGPKAGARGVGRKRKQPSKVDKLADDIWQATTPAAGEEALANLSSIVKRVDALEQEGRLDELLTHPKLASGIESIAARRDPAAREAAIELARQRVAALRNAPSTTDRAAAQLDRAAQARQSAGRPVSAEEAARMRAAGVPPPQPSNIAPGARQPEVQAFDLNPNEMPTDVDEARALGREAALERADRAPLGGMTLTERKKVFGKDLPTFLRGRDQNPPREARSRGERPPDTRDQKDIARAATLEQKVAEAQQAVDSAADQAARVSALARLSRAYAALDKAFPPRLVNDATGEVIKKVSTEQLIGKDIPKGYRLETGRKAYADSSVNRASPQDTLEDLFFGVTGFRRRGRRAISNTNADGMSAEDLSASMQDVREHFGPDADEFIDDLRGDTDARESTIPLDEDDADAAAPPGRRQRRGGQPLQSRVTDSLERGFGGVNPLAQENPKTKANFTAEEIARDVASRIRGLQPGTATYDMMIERFAKAVQDKYGTPALRTEEDAIAAGLAKPVSSRPQEPDATPPPAVADDLPATAGDAIEATPEAAKLDASATDLGGVAGDLPPPATGDTASVRIGDKEYVVPRAVLDDIQSQADAVREQEYQAAIAAGVPKRKAAIQAGEARKAYVERKIGEVHQAHAAGLSPTKGDVPPADATPAPAAADATPSPSASGDLPQPAGDLPPRADADPPAPDADRPPKADEDLPDAGGDLDDKRPKDGTPEGEAPPRDKGQGQQGGKPAPESLLKRLRSGAWKWGRRGAIAGGVLYGGRQLLDGLSQGAGGPFIPPPGAGGGGGGNMPPGGFPPFPPGGQGGDGDPVADAEARINAALEGMMRGDNLRGRLPQYQTPQTYNQWN